MTIIRKSVFQSSIRVLVGIIFIISAILKYISLDGFEMYVYRLGWFGFNMSAVLSRLLISFEFLLGVLFISHLIAKKIWYIALITLIGFSVFLFTESIKDIKDNCHCFGELIKMTPIESLFKNLVIMGLLFLIRKQKGISIRFQSIVVSIFIILITAIVFITSPPDHFIQERYEGRAGIINSTDNFLFQEFIHKNNFAEGKQIVCFFNMGCRFCKLASQKLSIMVQKAQDDIPVTYIFYGKENRLHYFWEDNASERFPVKIISVKSFFRMSNGRLPLILFLENGDIKGSYGYRDLNEKSFKAFINQ